MALPDIIRGTYVSVLIEEPAASNTWVPLCGLTTRSFTHQVNTNDTFIRDCDDPEDVPHRRLNVTGEQWDIAGSGLLNRSNLAMLNEAMGDRRNYRFVLDEPADDEVFSGYYYGPAMLTNKGITGADTENVTIDLSINSDGEWLWADAV